MTTNAEKLYTLSWDQFERDARALAWRLSALDMKWHAMVAITRGGLVPAALLSRELEIRTIETISIVSYFGKTQKDEPEIVKGLSAEIMHNGGKGVLVVDDLADTGNTLALVRKILPNAHYATVYAKPKGDHLVDTFVTEVSQDTWINFPWEASLNGPTP